MHDICTVNCHGKEKVENVKKSLKKVDLKETTKVFKVLAEENRSKIIFSLLEGEELCVHDLSNITGMTIANTSHHLRSLYAQELVKIRKEGRLSYYSLSDQRLQKIFENALALEIERELYV